MDPKEAEHLRNAFPALHFKVGVMVGGDHTYVPESQNFDITLSYTATQEEIENKVLEAIGDCSLKLMERVKERNQDVLFGADRVREAWSLEEEEEEEEDG